jgi:hypothetical protein
MLRAQQTVKLFECFLQGSSIIPFFEILIALKNLGYVLGAELGNFYSTVAIENCEEEDFLVDAVE